MEPETLYGAFEAEPSAALRAEHGGESARPRYNIAPTSRVSVVRPLREDPSRREVELMRWGLVPSWAKDVSVGKGMFNARAESLATKPAFRRALQRRRLLVPASGYYEWRKQPAGAPGGHGTGRPAKQPYYITPADGSVLAFAGLWEYWRPPDAGDDAGLLSMTIVTTDAVGAVRDIHDRMPLILPASDWAAWLDGTSDEPTVLAMLAPPGGELVEGLELRPVGPRVGNVRNDDPGLVTRVAG